MIKKLQHEAEIVCFANLLAQEGVRSYLEIGSKFGGSLMQVAQALPKGSRIVSVDLPGGNHESMMPLKECIEDIALDYDCRLFLGDSTSPQIIEAVRQLGPYDAIFIDANHTEAYVRQDWANYGPMGKLIAFHDIAHTKAIKAGRLPIEVKKVWDEIKGDYRHFEFKLDPAGNVNGIGVLWRENLTDKPGMWGAIKGDIE